MLLVRVFCLSAITLTPALSAQAQSVYDVTDLGTLGGQTSYAGGINDAGQIVGYSDDGYYQAFLWQNGTMTPLGTLGGVDSYGLGINSSGQVVGYSQVTPNGFDDAFLWKNATINDLGTLPSQAASEASGVNDAGAVVGSAYTPSPGAQQAVLWQNGSITQLGTLGGSYSTANAINNVGQIVGDSYTSNGQEHAVLWQNGAMQDLGTLGGQSSRAFAINDAGQVVGISDNQAFLWQNGTMHVLDTVAGTYSIPDGINRNGTIVGYATTPDGKSTHAVAWLNAGATPVDLNSLLPANSGWVLQQASAINNNGQIVGTGLHNGLTRGFELNILPPLSNVAPGQVAPQTPQNLTLVTHGFWGYYPDNPTSDGWVAQMTAAIAERLPAAERSNFQVMGYDWYAYNQASTVSWDQALSNGVQLGNTIGAQISYDGFQHVHLIAHSAGAGLIAAAGAQISESPSTSIQYTYLSPYTPPVSLASVNGSYLPDTWYGVNQSTRPEDWAEHYSSYTATAFPFTTPILAGARNVDVKNLDPNWLVDTLNPSGSHAWAYQYYLATVVNGGTFPGSTDPRGFALSLEGGHVIPGTSAWQNPSSSLPEGNLLPDSPGAANGSTLPQVHIDPALSQSSMLSIVLGGGAEGPGAGAGATHIFVSATTATPGWERADLDFANPVNALTMHIQFSSTPGSTGVLEVYIDNQPVGQVNEAFSLGGNQEYAFGLSETLTGIHELAFRFDHESGQGAAAVDVNDFHTAFVPLPEPGTMLLTLIGAVLATGLIRRN